MDVRISQPLGYSELGSRGNNEDYIYPDPVNVTIQQRWFMVCDGVGGSEKGEVASMLAASVLDGFFRQQQANLVATDEFIQKAVASAEQQFRNYLQENEQAAGMATTLTLLYLHNAGATIAHIGDSRIYHVRGGEIIWRSEDHSYVNELVKAGVLTPDEARNHPQRNVITRALQGGEKSVQASVQIINKLKAGDYFFLCTDGVLERISDELLEGTLGETTISNEVKLERLRSYSYGNTRDNFSAYLIQIEAVSGSIDPIYRTEVPLYKRMEINHSSEESITLINVPVPEDSYHQMSSYKEELRTATEVFPKRITQDTAKVSVRRKAKSSTARLLTIVITSIVLGAGGFTVWHLYLQSKEQNFIVGSGKRITQNKPVPGKMPTASRPTALSDSGGFDAHLQSSDLPIKNYKEVRKVANNLLIVSDPDTKLRGLRTTNNEWVAPPRYNRIGDFKNGVATVIINENENDEKRYLSLNGQEFEEVKAASYGRIAVRKGDKWGYLDYNGEIQIKPLFEKAGTFRADSTAEVTLNGKVIRVDSRGKTI